MCFQILILFIAYLLKGEVDGAHLVTTSTAPLHDIVYSCTGQQVKILWQFELDATAGEEVSDIRWYFSGTSQELIAVWADGEFLPLPAFHKRVEEYGNAGLILNNVTVADSGNYSVLISIHNDADEFMTIKRSTIVQIGDTVMTQDGQLHVSQKPEAVLDTATNQWAIQLRCGNFTYLSDPPFQVEWQVSNFTYLSDPPFQVEWQTPSSEQVRASSDYSANHFNLLLLDPVTGGNYTCRIPPQQASTACLRQNEMQKGESTVLVNKVLARLSLLESENKQLKEELQQSNCTCP